MKLKICGVTDAGTAALCAREGADYIGVIFAEGSPRRVPVEVAAEIVRAARAASPRVRCAGVFTRHSAAEIVETARKLRLDVVQLHAPYADADVAALKAQGLEVWRLRRGGEAFAPCEDAVVVDGSDGRSSGGTGVLADWSLVDAFAESGLRVVLAGGISSANVAAAARTRADVIDVNSSLETSPGVKGEALIDSFFSTWNGLVAAGDFRLSIFLLPTVRANDIIRANQQA